MALVQQLQPSQTFQQYIDSPDRIVQSSSIFCKGSKHISTTNTSVRWEGLKKLTLQASISKSFKESWTENALYHHSSHSPKAFTTNRMLLHCTSLKSRNGLKSSFLLHSPTSVWSLLRNGHISTGKRLMRHSISFGE
jgi:hypothetical protein